ncbi:glycine--tRNA ligase subunit beta [Microaceticoccus formicicus]|uniref:glycine--tRNA ligase subunit beta n=1 Tax=Microaceticoccus formicicus TaxID=3118105 RepID=UPI003CD01E2A|nr:glycine--tRNA ligase subunit beta [Peptoniphilaceae bacterium AMB_02]
MKDNFLLEIGVEEMPAAYVESTKKQLKSAFEKLLNENKVVFDGIEVESTPRRFATFVRGIVQETDETSHKVKGPSKKIAYDESGKPTKALMGFLRGQGKEESDVTLDLVGNEEYVFVEKKVEQKPVSELIKEEVSGIIKSIVFPKTMRWGGKKL